MIQNFLSFLDQSPTAWHAVSTCVEQLKQSHFIRLKEEERWSIEPEKGYVVTRDGSSLCAFVTPKVLPKRIRLLVSHTDSPGLKLKPHPEICKNQLILLGVEVYGSPILSSWFNRDLGIAGRVLYKDNQGLIRENLVRLNHYPAIIPHLAIHLDREVNEKGLQLNKQEHLNALIALENNKIKGSLLEELLREHLELSKLISHDLFLFPLEQARLIGYQHSFLSAYRIDSLASVHAALTALLNQPEPLFDEIKMIMFWDNEEIGSKTIQGAESPFFNQIMERIMSSYTATKEDYFCLLNSSTCVSIDLAHALHPNYSDKHDSQHQPKLGQGIVIKNNAQQRYATNARSSLPIFEIASNQNIPLQYFVSRNDIPCGSTIGPIHASLTGIPTVDIGCSQLSMHASREIMACEDHLTMCHLLENLFKTKEWPETEAIR